VRVLIIYFKKYWWSKWSLLWDKITSEWFRQKYYFCYCHHRQK